MARLDAHVAVVRGNVRLLTDVLLPVVDAHPDWVATVAFYTAMHRACNRGRIRGRKAANGRDWLVDRTELLRVEAEGLSRVTP